MLINFLLPQRFWKIFLIKTKNKIWEIKTFENDQENKIWENKISINQINKQASENSMNLISKYEIKDKDETNKSHTLASYTLVERLFIQILVWYIKLGSILDFCSNLTYHFSRKFEGITRNSPSFLISLTRESLLKLIMKLYRFWATSLANCF